MKYVVTINDKNYEVEVEQGQATIVRTTQAAVVPVPTVEPAPAASAEPIKPTVQPDTMSGESIKAPMPGVVVAVLVKPGDAVQKGQVMFIVEAMKMESEIFAERDGVVSQVMVAKGSSLSTGDILLTLK